MIENSGRRGPFASLRATANAEHNTNAHPLGFNVSALSFAMMLTSAMMSTGCGEGSPAQKMAQAFQTGTTTPDEVPKVINAELPFRYPAPLYARRAQGNVTLRIFIDRNGLVRGDSTRVEETSGYPALDTAALKGSAALRFVPAKLHGEPMPVTVLFPVYFRHPEARALPGDTILNKRGPTP